MRKLVLTVVVAGAIALTAETPRTFTGVITDTMCGGDHSHMKILPLEKCVRECIRSDKRFKYALYDGKRVYVLSDQATPETFAAKRVKVTGALFEKTGVIQVDKIELAK